MAITFAFGKEFQETMIAYMLKDISFAEKCYRHIDSEQLKTDGLKWIFTTIGKSLETNGTVPGSLELEDELKYVEVGRRKLLKISIDHIQEVEIKSIPFVKEKLGEWAKKIKYHEVFIESQSLYNSGKTEEAFEYTNIGMNDLHNISFFDDEMISGEDLEKKRQNFMKQMALAGTRFVPTMIKELDEILGGGLEMGRMGVLLAEPKKGKSIGLVHMTAMALMMRSFNVVHFILEGTTEETLMRLQSRMTGIPYYKIYHDDLTRGEEDALEKSSRMCRRLRLIPMNKHWEYTTQDIDARLSELERGGFKSNLVVVDYGDLLKGRSSFKASEKRHEQTEVYRDLKKIAMNRSVALWTASQAARPKDAPEKEYLLRAKDISESYEKVRIADFIGTLNMTIREKKLGILRFHADTYRSNDCDRTIRLVTNFKKMIFSSSRYPTVTTPSWKRRIKRK